MADARARLDRRSAVVPPPRLVRQPRWVDTARPLGSLRLAIALAVGFAASAACSSPNRGRWQGTFEGGVTGSMELTVNARGTEADGKITGATRSGENFEASFEGSLNQGFLNARFEGSGQTGVGLPAGFRGELQGTLEHGRGEGKWNVDLIQVRVHYDGSWSATQVAD